jgi:peptidoglycan/xylan/chitin deacetylase (PgdA/CDA1 family)
MVTLTDFLFKYYNDPQAIAITFDDGYRDISDYALPVMKKHNIPATVFLITSYIGKRNMWDLNLGWIRYEHLGEKDIELLIDNGWEIGSHTVTHRCLVGMDKETVKYEIAESKKYLEDKFKINVFYLSLPFGKINKFILEEALSEGYKGICGFYPFQYYNNLRRNKEILPRLAVYRTDSLSSIDRKLSTGLKLRREIFKQNIINFCSNATILVNSLR